MRIQRYGLAGDVCDEYCKRCCTYHGTYVQVVVCGVGSAEAKVASTRGIANTHPPPSTSSVVATLGEEVLSLNHREE